MNFPVLPPGKPSAQVGEILLHKSLLNSHCFQETNTKRIQTPSLHLGSIVCTRSVIVIADTISVITTLPGGPDGATPYTPVARPTRLDIFANGFCVQQLSWSNKHALLPSKTRQASNAKIVPKRPKNALLSRRPPESQPRVSV